MHKLESYQKWRNLTTDYEICFAFVYDYEIFLGHMKIISKNRHNLSIGIRSKNL